MKKETRDGSKGGKYAAYLNIRMSPEEKEEICKYAEEKNVSVSETVRRAVRLYFYQMNLRKNNKI